jgi:aldose 1-epimerase
MGADKMSRKRKPLIGDYNLNGLDGIMFSAGGYRAVVLPGRGANVVLLDNTVLGASILRTPRTKDSYDENPSLFGIPVLFPPNRIDMGKFSACGRNYSFPVNETERGNHLHGFLSDAQWNVESKKAAGDYAEITLSFKNTETSHFFDYYPLLFKITIVNRLSADGLFQDVSIINNGNTDMPFGLGFHTTFNLPFHPDGSVDDIRLMMTVEGKWELDERMLPTGRKLFPQDWESELGQDGIIPLEHPLDNHYPAKPMQHEDGEFNRAVLIDFFAGLRIIYEVGKSFKHWMLYNGMENRKDFICPEPQTWMVNAPNIDKPADETGLIILSPGETWTDYTKIKVEKFDM